MPGSRTLALIVEAHRPQLTAYIERRLGPALRRKIEPADIVQETALTVLENPPPEGRDPFGWLCQLAEQRIVDVARRFGAAKRDAAREVSVHVPKGDDSRDLADLLAASLTSPSQAAMRDERHSRLMTVVATLPQTSQQLLRWRYVEGLPTKEIAERMGKTDGAVRVLLTRTLRKLQELLGHEAAP